MSNIYFVKIKGEWAVKPDGWTEGSMVVNTNDDPKIVNALLGIPLSLLTEAYGKVYKAEEAAEKAAAEAPAEEEAPAPKKKSHKKK